MSDRTWSISESGGRSALASFSSRLARPTTGVTNPNRSREAMEAIFSRFKTPCGCVVTLRIRVG
jgi:hypothetical protein